MNPNPPEKTRLDISLASQSLRLLRGDEILFQATISSATNGIGFAEGSYRTPTGHFRIREKIGDGAPLYTAFLGRRPLGIWTPQSEICDAILTRIMWLDGLDPENANTYQRYIYLHGTQAESDLGRPASLGCIRLGNEDMLILFNLTPLLTPVTIREP